MTMVIHSRVTAQKTSNGKRRGVRNAKATSSWSGVKVSVGCEADARIHRVLAGLPFLNGQARDFKPSRQEPLGMNQRLISPCGSSELFWHSYEFGNL